MYKTINCKDANEFWECLDPRNPLKLDLEREKKELLLFRGQENSEYKLLPACFRKHFDKNTYMTTLTAEEQINAEYEEFLHFIKSEEYVDVSKDGIFDKENELLSKFNMNLIYEKPSLWPPKEIYNSLFLAQHHGAATRLLDWTKKSYMAVYFACQPLIDKISDFNKKTEEKIAVWCYLPNENNDRIMIENYPKNYDKNMIAQNGRFTLVKQNITDIKKIFKIETLDDIASENNLWKITVPKLKLDIFSLMENCFDNGISAETVYKGRGLDCVTMAFREKETWTNEIKRHSNTGLDDGFDKVEL